MSERSPNFLFIAAELCHRVFSNARVVWLLIYTCTVGTYVHLPFNDTFPPAAAAFLPMNILLQPHLFSWHWKCRWNIPATCKGIIQRHFRIHSILQWPFWLVPLARKRPVKTKQTQQVLIYPKTCPLIYGQSQRGKWWMPRRIIRLCTTGYICGKCKFTSFPSKKKCDNADCRDRPRCNIVKFQLFVNASTPSGLQLRNFSSWLLYRANVFKNSACAYIQVSIQVLFFKIYINRFGPCSARFSQRDVRCASLPAGYFSFLLFRRTHIRNSINSARLRETTLLLVITFKYWLNINVQKCTV